MLNEHLCFYLYLRFMVFETSPVDNDDECGNGWTWTWIIMTFLVDMFCRCNQFIWFRSLFTPMVHFPFSYSCPFPSHLAHVLSPFLRRLLLINCNLCFFFSHYPLVWMPFFLHFLP
ncbi:hypothetical protein VTN00DRAFT_5728 [Thermoascus crustaceus]|uniref:uncharacterized protein n=1 Tax=Thermoascus crustaceus TaxID=5088 RepID=UPI0037420E6B